MWNKTTHPGIGPVLDAHLMARCIDPGQISNIELLIVCSRQKTITAAAVYGEPVGLAPGKTAGEIESKANEVIRSSVRKDLVSPEERHARISRAAFSRAERRRFEGDHTLDDWLKAEREVDAQIND